MLKGDTLPKEERDLVRKSIERLKQGVNRERLAAVPVVGVSGCLPFPRARVSVLLYPCQALCGRLTAAGGRQVTCAASSFACLDKLQFPIVLLDECCQMTEPNALLPVAKWVPLPAATGLPRRVLSLVPPGICRFVCRKLILVGDPKQLGPTIEGPKPAHMQGLEQTLFDRLLAMGKSPVVLRTQYRCHPLISQFSNEAFYDGRLLNGVTEGMRARLSQSVPTLGFYDVEQGRERCDREGSFSNAQEAAFVLTLLGHFLEAGVSPRDVGVITLYKAQSTLIRQLIDQDL